jgi:multimeric flavodoxin WrbA
MRTVVLDGARPGEQAVDEVRLALLDALAKRGHLAQSFALRDLHMVPCIGCFGCWVQAPGECLVHDDAGRVARAFVRAELAVFLSAVTFGGYSSELKKALDRCICLISPFFEQVRGETHHRPRYGRYPRILAVGVTAGGAPEAGDIFRALVERNAVNLHTPAHETVLVEAGDSPDAARSRIAAALAELEGGP